MKIMGYTLPIMWLCKVGLLGVYFSVQLCAYDQWDCAEWNGMKLEYVLGAIVAVVCVKQCPNLHVSLRRARLA